MTIATQPAVETSKLSPTSGKQIERFVTKTNRSALNEKDIVSDSDSVLDANSATDTATGDAGTSNFEIGDRIQLAQADVPAAATEAAAAPQAASAVAGSTAEAGAAGAGAAGSTALTAGSSLTLGGIGMIAAGVGVVAVVAGASKSSDTPAPVAPAADTTAPVVAITAVTDNVGSVQGVLATGGTTDDTALVISGTTEAGATVKIYDGATLLGTATVSGTTWSYSATVANGTTYQFNAKATDAAGNTSAATANFTVIGDTTAPTATAAIVSVTDNYGTNTGTLTTGGTTDDTSLALAGTITGTLGSGEVVAVYDGATRLGTATVTGANWAYTDSTLTNGDTTSYTVRVEDAAGNVGTASSPAFATTISAPTATAAITLVTDNVGAVTTNLITGGRTDDTSLVLSGTITGTLGSDTVVVYDGATLLGTATVSGSTWNYTDSTLANGDVTSYTVVVKNGAGDQGTASAAFVTTIDTVAPTVALTAATDDVGSVTGALTSGNTTDDTALLLSGTNEAGATVSVYNDATLLGAAIVTGTTWTYSATVADGTTYQFNAKATDVAGNTSAATANFTVIGDTSAPSATAAIATVTDNFGVNTGALTTGGTTDDTSLALAGTITGTLGSGEVVAVYDGATRLGNATVSGASWTYTDSTLANGDSTSYTVRVEDAAGNRGTASTPAFVTTIDTAAPAVAFSAATDNVGSVVGALTSGNTTDDTALVLTGTNEAGATVSVYNGATLLGAATVSGTTWLYSATVANGTTYQFNAKATDAAGNTSAATANFTVIGDTAAPTATAAVATVTDDFGANTGVLPSGGTTDDTSLALAGAITGTLGSGEVVAVYDGATRLGNATVIGGNWTYTDSTLANGDTTSYTVRVEDAAGNVGTASSPAFVTTISAPTATAAITVVADNVGSVTTNLITGGRTDDTSLVLSGTITGTLNGGEVVAVYDGATLLGTATVSGSTWNYTDATLANGDVTSYTVVVKNGAGDQGTASAAFVTTIDTVAPAVALTAANDNVGSVTGTLTSGNTTDDTALVLSGTNEAGATVNVYNGATLLGAATVSGTTWLYSATVANGTTYQFNAQATDAAGNTSVATANFTVIGDTAAPTATAAISSVTDDFGASQGALTSGGTTDDTSLDLAGTITGTLGSGEVVAVYDGATRLGNATVSGANWTYTDSTLANGDVTSYTVRGEDAAGNVGTASSPAFVSTINTATVAPSTPNLDFSSDTGFSNTDNLTNDTTPTFTGTGGAPGATITLYEGATVLGTTTVDGSGNWAVTSSALAEGVHNISAKQTYSGDTSLASSALAVTIDTTAPTNRGSGFSETTNSSIVLSFSEAVTANSNGWNLHKNPDLNDGHGGWGTTATNPGSVSGSGTTTLTYTTSLNLAATDIVRANYYSSWGNITDLAGNAMAQGEIWIGGTGANTIDLQNYGSSYPITLNGNGGNDTLIGTNKADKFIDGAGADTIQGRNGADTIVLVENGGVSGGAAFARDTLKFALGDSTDATSTSYDRVTGTPAFAGSGFDAKSATIANHDVLSLPSNTIAANTVGNVNGTDVNTIAQHSISGGIVTFKDTAGTAITINATTGLNFDAVNYLRTNIHSPGTTVAFEIDSDGNGTVDSLVVFQDNGALPLHGNYDLPDTLVVLGGVTGVTLGNTEGANVVHIVDTQNPHSTGMDLTTDGFAFNFAENVTFGATPALTLQLNGTGTQYSTISSIDGNGTSNVTLHFSGLALNGTTDWAVLRYSGSTTTNSFYDAAGNITTPGGGTYTEAIGSDGNNTIDLSVLGLTTGMDIEGNGGNDIIVGDSGSNSIRAGTGADTMTGGAGSDSFHFQQGDCPTLVFAEHGGAGVSTGDTFTFTAGADRITDFSSGDDFGIHGLKQDYTGFASPTWMSPSGTAATAAVPPTNGLASDQGYFYVRGDYSTGNGTFTVNTSTGTDTLVVMDGDATSAVTQTGLVLSGVTLAHLNAWDSGASYLV